MKELNLENPIFVIYFNVENLNMLKVKHMIQQLKDSFSFSNVTTWVVPCDYTKIEIIWNGTYSSNDGKTEKNIRYLSDKLNKISK